MGKQSAYGVHRLGVKPSERFAAAVSGIAEQHSDDGGELGDDQREPDSDDHDPVSS